VNNLMLFDIAGRFLQCASHKLTCSSKTIMS